MGYEMVVNSKKCSGTTHKYAILDTGVQVTYSFDDDAGPAYGAAGPAQIRRTKILHVGSKVYSTVGKQDYSFEHLNSPPS